MNAPGQQVAPQPADGALPKGRSPLAHLLHALNQPLTGLQCSLELAAAGRRRPEEYVRTLREGLDLTARMRVLVEAIRELTDTRPEAGAGEIFRFDGLLRDTADELRPVGEAIGVHLLLASSIPLSVKADRRSIATLIFRLLESALALTQKGSDLHVALTPDPGQVCFAVSWNPGPLPQHSPFSREELALLVAQAGFERAGWQWTHTREKPMHICTVRLPPKSAFASLQACKSGDLE